MLYLPPKNAADVTDYQIDFASLIPSGVSLDSKEVSIVDSGTGESPMTLTCVDTAFGADTSPPEADSVLLIWLAGGTKDTVYRGKCIVSDSQSADPDRTYTRYFQIEVRDDL